MVQYRDKSSDKDRRRRDAAAMKKICDEAGVPLLINDDVGLAREIGAAGVHLGGHDGDFASARQELGAQAILGSSCYASLDRALRALHDGADYVSFGAFHPSATKPSAPIAPLSVLQEAKSAIRLPIAAIGGIDATNGKPLIEAGADLLAVIGGVCAAADPESSARAINRLFTQIHA
jgi:thiamine-phosphate pyrophosphorylase